MAGRIWNTVFLRVKCLSIVMKKKTVLRKLRNPNIFNIQNQFSLVDFYSFYSFFLMSYSRIMRLLKAVNHLNIYDMIGQFSIILILRTWISREKRIKSIHLLLILCINSKVLHWLYFSKQDHNLCYNMPESCYFGLGKRPKNA